MKSVYGKTPHNHILICFYYLLLLQTGVELELVEKISLLEWLANNYKNFGKHLLPPRLFVNLRLNLMFEVWWNFCFLVTLSGATLEIITDRSQEGAQFCKGFGGIGGENPLLII